MNAPWQTYSEMQPISSAGMSLVDAFSQLVYERWDIHSVELYDEVNRDVPEGAPPTIELLRLCALMFQEAVFDGSLRTAARPLNGGEPVELTPVHWEIDDPLARFATGCLNLGSWSDPKADPTHRIFVHRADFRAFIRSIPTEDEVWEALSHEDAHPTPAESQSEPTPTACTTDEHRLLSELPAEVPEDRILRRPEVITLCGLSRSSIDNLMKDRKFPASVKIGPSAVGWHQSAIMEWIASRPKAPSLL